MNGDTRSLPLPRFLGALSPGFETLRAQKRRRDPAQPPLRVFFGDGPLAIATADSEQRLASWRRWEPLSVAAHGAH
ncbi:MAG: hypothetical protein ABW328_16860 [Ilumatobacteraceae bacterium]